MKCPKCNSNVYSHHQKINKSRTEIVRDYGCHKCKYVFQTVERVIDTEKNLYQQTESFNREVEQ
jgi:transcriptional regulator NrdR family protein|nr:MAG TPA: Transcription factor S-II (TFIIS) [Caudoviricetes sp.]